MDYDLGEIDLKPITATLLPIALRPLNYSLPALGGPPMTRETLLELLGQLSDEERVELGIIDPITPPTLERDDVLDLLVGLTEEEREGLGIPGSGTPGLVNLSLRSGVTYTTADYAGDSPRPPVRYAGVELAGVVGEIRQVIAALRPQYVQGGETVSVAIVTSFDGVVFLEATASVVLEAGQTQVIIPLTFTANYVTVLLGTDDGDPRMFWASDVTPTTPAAPKCVFYDGTLQSWTGVLTETNEPYMRAFQLDRPAEPKGVNGPADPVDYVNAGIDRASLGDIPVGFMYFDQNVNAPIWWTGFSWVDSGGNLV